VKVTRPVVIPPALIKLLIEMKSFQSALARKVYHNHLLLRNYKRHVVNHANIADTVNKKLATMDQKTSMKLQQQMMQLKNLVNLYCLTFLLFIYSHLNHCALS
jgi:hypothetical protein